MITKKELEELKVAKDLRLRDFVRLVEAVECMAECLKKRKDHEVGCAADTTFGSTLAAGEDEWLCTCGYERTLYTLKHYNGDK